MPHERDEREVTNFPTIEWISHALAYKAGGLLEGYLNFEKRDMQINVPTQTQKV